MKPILITTNPWQHITQAAKAAKQKSYVAVAYFGKEGAKLLPLKKGDILVVDASNGALKAGQTNPWALLQLYKKGVVIYSYKDLHAKVFVLGTKAFVGSTNVSGYSANTLKEATLCTTDRDIVKQVREFVTGLCEGLLPLGGQAIKNMEEIYRPPKDMPAGGGKRKTIVENKRPPLYVCRLIPEAYPEGSGKTVAEGTKEARKKMQHPRLHRLEDFRWIGKLSFSEGDTVVQIIKEGDEEYVSPPGRVLKIKKWKNSAFVFLEVPAKRRKSVTAVAKYIAPADLKRGGRKREEVKKQFLKLFKTNL